MLEQDWPVFSRGTGTHRMRPFDPKWSIFAAYRDWRGPGYAWRLIVGDQDGVLVIPHKVEDEVLALALEKASGEKVVRKAIEAGMTSTEAFRKYGICDD